MKKYFIIILTIVAALCMATGCAKKSGGADKSSDKEAVSVVDDSAELSGGEISSEYDSSAQGGEQSAPVHEHAFGDYEVVTEATLEKDGELIRYCGGCGESETIAYSIENAENGGANSIKMANHTVYAEYSASVVTVTFITDGDFAEEYGVYYTECADEGLSDDNAWLVRAESDDSVFVYTYRDRAFETAIGSTITANFMERGYYKAVTVILPRKSAESAFAFFPTVSVHGETSTYAENNAFVVKKYAESWLRLNDNNKIYYRDYSVYENNSHERPSFSGGDDVFAGVIKEGSVEEAIVATKIAEEKGADGFDLHLNYLHANGLLNEQSIRRIVNCTALPILALNYNSSLSQEARRDGLMIAVAAGCAAVDLQGFMFWTGSTVNTQTQENVAFWTARGYDMSFVSAKPSETVIDPETVNMQKDFIDGVHELGAEVLMSFHVGVTFTAEQAVAFAKFQSVKGADVIKLVGVGSGVEDVENCVQAVKTVAKEGLEGGAKFSYHLSGDPSVYISRVICPVFYGSYIAFCYPELTEWQDAGQLDLSMAVAAKAARAENREDLTAPEAVELVAKYVSHPQLDKLVYDYKNAPSVKCKAYGANSDMSDRWSFNKENYHLQLRDASGTNSFNMRAYAYDISGKSKDGAYISADISGTLYPYTSSSRKPKLGVYVGNEEKMLAFVCDISAKKAYLAANTKGRFGFDDGVKSDVLYDLGLADVSLEVNLASENITLAMEVTGETITLFLNGETAAEIAMTSELYGYIGRNLDGSAYSGVVVEVYMGSSSVGKVNYVDFKNVSYSK